MRNLDLEGLFRGDFCAGRSGPIKEDSSWRSKRRGEEEDAVSENSLSFCSLFGDWCFLGDLLPVSQSDRLEGTMLHSATAFDALADETESEGKLNGDPGLGSEEEEEDEEEDEEEEEEDGEEEGERRWSNVDAKGEEGE